MVFRGSGVDEELLFGDGEPESELEIKSQPLVTNTTNINVQ
jgi:hypothetical protein